MLIPAGTFGTGTKPTTLDDYKAFAGGELESWFRDRVRGRREDVALPAFWIGKVEVTVGQYRAFLRARSDYAPTYRESSAGAITGGRRDEPGGKPSYFGFLPGCSWEQPDPGWFPPDDHPVSSVSRDDAGAYCAWAGLRLPSRDEWERAALWDPVHGHCCRWAWGDDLPAPEALARVANLADASFLREYPGRAGLTWAGDDGHARTAPVGSFPDGASPSGCLDMTGNVCEWCAGVDPASGECFFRGGGWADLPWHAEGGLVGARPADARSSNRGFRVARDVTPEELAEWERTARPR